MNFSKEDILKWKGLKLWLNDLKYGYYLQYTSFSYYELNLHFISENNTITPDVTCVFDKFGKHVKWLQNPTPIMKEFLDFLIEKRSQLENENGVCYSVSYVARCLDEALFNFSENDSNTNAVNHPQHYNTASIECIKLMLELYGLEAVKSFCKCNALKYLYRADNKNGLEDIKKAAWYLNKYVEVVKNDE